MHKVYLSPSLQESNIGVGTYGTEMDRMFLVAHAAGRKLGRNGVETRTSARWWSTLDSNSLLSHVVNASNSWGADLHICIHSNAGPRMADGTMTMYMPGSANGRRIASLVQKHVAPLSPGTDIGLVTSPVFYETRAAAAPVAYLELAFHTNPADAKSVIEHADDYGAAIADACLEYFGIKAKPKPQPVLITVKTPAVKPKWWAKLLALVKRQKKPGA